MVEERDSRPVSVIGQSGRPITLEALPIGNSGRWIARRKAELVAAIVGGLLSFEEARARYALTVEELASWQRQLERGGVPGLRASELRRRRAARSKTDPAE